VQKGCTVLLEVCITKEKERLRVFFNNKQVLNF